MCAKLHMLNSLRYSHSEVRFRSAPGLVSIFGAASAYHLMNELHFYAFLSAFACACVAWWRFSIALFVAGWMAGSVYILSLPDTALTVVPLVLIVAEWLVPQYVLPQYVLPLFVAKHSNQDHIHTRIHTIQDACSAVASAVCAWLLLPTYDWWLLVPAVLLVAFTARQLALNGRMQLQRVFTAALPNSHEHWWEAARTAAAAVLAAMVILFPLLSVLALVAVATGLSVCDSKQM